MGICYHNDNTRYRASYSAEHLSVYYFSCSASMFYVPMKFLSKFYADKFFVMYHAWLLLFATAILWQCVNHDLYQCSRFIYPVPANFIANSERYLKSSVVIILMFYTGLWNVKLSILLFLRLISKGLRGQKLHWIVVVLFKFATSCVCIGTISYKRFVSPFMKIVFNCNGSDIIKFQRMTLKFHCAMYTLTNGMGEATICSSAEDFADHISVMSIPFL